MLFRSFGASAGPAGVGYYSFDLGAWHIVVLNSSAPVGQGSLQAAWLRADLAASQARCTLAAWHHPRYSSGRHGNADEMRAMWRELYTAGADVVLSGHDHDYERFAPQDADSGLDGDRGVRQFVVGTGGAVPTQRRDDDAESFRGQRWCHLIPCRRVIRPAVDEKQGLPFLLAVKRHLHEIGRAHV